MPPPVRARQARKVPRARPGTRTILNPQNPTVTLTRVQTGIGALTFEAAASDTVGDLRLGCAYQLRSGASSTVQYAGGSHVAPPNSTRPVIVAHHDRFERISIDLRQCRDVERLIIYGFSESRAQLRWGGTLLATAFGNARIEVPLDADPSDAVTVFLSLYNVDGEFVLRAEMEAITGSIREASKAYGFDAITWQDDRTPVG
jgi:hypothetical protein